ncbi:hypothetical protein F0A16_03415 [Salinicola corii]|uniref:Uncharacterized protein n=1 Tax=Salinicola corii TaxID=2606937 RepID=A0A640WJY3_9GAMM|nr:hypothetical protein [Salinicola corii]KAA0020842.1 hypothetical protein F0A16_03415 [Salinicola corii]
MAMVSPVVQMWVNRSILGLRAAHKYYDLSGTSGAESKNRIAKEMTQEQIDEALRQSQEWQKEHNVQIGGGFIRRAD